MIRPADDKPLAGSRDFGIVIRTRIEEALAGGDDVVVELGGLEDMSPSFADECFGKLSEQFGEDVRSRRVQVRNEEPFRVLLDGVIAVRLHRAQARAARPHASR